MLHLVNNLLPRRILSHMREPARRLTPAIEQIGLRKNILSSVQYATQAANLPDIRRVLGVRALQNQRPFKVCRAKAAVLLDPYLGRFGDAVEPQVVGTFVNFGEQAAF